MSDRNAPAVPHDSIPSVLDHLGRPVTPAVLGGAQRAPLGRVCYGVTTWNSRAAAAGRAPTCFGVPGVEKPGTALVSAPETAPVFQPASAVFRFSCTGKAVYFEQPPSEVAGRVATPTCAGLEILVQSLREDGAAAAQAPVRPPPPRPPPSPFPPSRPRQEPVVIDVSAYFARWQRSAEKIGARMRDNLNAISSALFGGGRR